MTKTQRAKQAWAKQRFKLESSRYSALFYRVSNPKSNELADLQMVKEDDIFDIIKQAHEEVGYLRVKRAYNFNREKYHGITQVDVAELLSHCSVCAM